MKNLLQITRTPAVVTGHALHLRQQHYIDSIKAALRGTAMLWHPGYKPQQHRPSFCIDYRIPSRD